MVRRGTVNATVLLVLMLVIGCGEQDSSVRTTTVGQTGRSASTSAAATAASHATMEAEVTPYPTPAATSTPGGIPDGAVALVGTITISGDVQRTQAFIVRPTVYPHEPVSCADYAEGSRDGTRRVNWAPSPINGWKVEDIDPINVLVRVMPYDGPGVYDRASGVGSATPDEIAEADANEMGIEQFPSVAAGGVTFNELAEDASITLTIESDGAGRMIFTNLRTSAALAAELSEPVRTISGEMTWTCDIHHEP